MEGYRSGHNGAVLKTVRAKAHAGSNPAPSAKNRTPPIRAGFCFSGTAGMCVSIGGFLRDCILVFKGMSDEDCQVYMCVF